MRLLQRFQSFALAPDFMPAGALPPAHWAGMPGRQGVEKIHPAINFTLHSKVRLRGLLFSRRFCSDRNRNRGVLFVGWRLDVCRACVFFVSVFGYGYGYGCGHGFLDVVLLGGGVRGTASLLVRGGFMSTRAPPFISKGKRR